MSLEKIDWQTVDSTDVPRAPTERFLLQIGLRMRTEVAKAPTEEVAFELEEQPRKFMKKNDSSLLPSFCLLVY